MRKPWTRSHFALIRIKKRERVPRCERGLYTVRMMRDGFLDELEWQFAAEREQEQQLLDMEAERLRVARLTLLDRVMALWEAATLVQVSTGTLLHDGILQQVGADWMGLASESNRDHLTVIPLAAVREIRSVETGTAEVLTPVSGVQRRMTFGYLCRDLARRRSVVQLALQDSDWVRASIVRAGIDHCDIQLEGAATAKQTRIVSFHAVAAVRLTAHTGT